MTMVIKQKEKVNIKLSEEKAVTAFLQKSSSFLLLELTFL